MAASGAGGGAGAAMPTGEPAVAAASASPVTEVSTVDDFNAAATDSKLVVAFFWAEFHPPSKRGGQMDNVFTQLAKMHTDVRFVKVDAEAVPEVSLRYELAVVPTFVFLLAGKLLGKQEGADAAGLAANVETFKKQASTGSATGKGAAKTVDAALATRLKALVNTSRVMLFMKGTPSHPECNYSREVAQLLTKAGISFSSLDILTEPDVRAGLKVLFDFPTFPQLYVNGKLLGGHSTIVAMASADPTLAGLQPPKDQGKASGAAPAAAAGGKTSLESRLKSLVAKAPVMLFMKGSPDTPRCGFSRKAVALLREHKIKFDSFDILSDNEVRQGLKKFSNWPTYPQLYVKGELKGGLDILKEMAEESDDLAEELGIAGDDLTARLQGLVTKSRAMLFMKGSPDEPRCGFSRKAVALLREHKIKFDSFDILSDNEVRQGLKKFSNWPTYPQLYVDGKLVGGLDILKEMAEDGELEELV